MLCVSPVVIEWHHPDSQHSTLPWSVRITNRTLFISIPNLRPTHYCRMMTRTSSLVTVALLLLLLALVALSQLLPLSQLLRPLRQQALLVPPAAPRPLMRVMLMWLMTSQHTQQQRCQGM